jgi:putative Mn2+ efflux pump MntP
VFQRESDLPRILAAFGIFSFLLMLIVSFANILLPNYAAMVEFAFAPAALFEIVIGLWLLIKGVNVEQWEKRALESA